MSATCGCKRCKGRDWRRLCPHHGCNYTATFCDQGGGDSEAKLNVRVHRLSKHGDRPRV